MIKRVLVVLGFLAVVAIFFFLLPKSESRVRIVPHTEVLNRNLGLGVQYWLNNEEILVQEDSYANSELQGAQLLRYNLSEKKKTPIAGLAEKLGKLIIRWQLSPDRQRLLAAVRTGDKTEFVTVKLDGSEVVRVPAIYPGEYFCGWLADSTGWLEFQEKYKDKSPNVVTHGLDGKEILPRKKFSTLIYEMRMRLYQNMLPNGNWYEVPYLEAGAMGAGKLHLQLKGYKDPTIPLKEFEILVPSDMHLSAFALSPDRTQIAWLSYSEKGGGPDGNEYAQRLLITRLDTNKTQEIANEAINLDIATRQDSDRHLLLTWSPDGKKLAYCLNGELRIADYGAIQGTPPPASVALPVE